MRHEIRSSSSSSTFSSPCRVAPAFAAVLGALTLLFLPLALSAEEGDQPAAAKAAAPPAAAADELPEEPFLKNITQLTFEGDNGEAYWSSDGKQIIFQSKRGNLEFDQIFMMSADAKMLRMVSTGRGRTTCSYFAPDGKKIIYASTHLREGPPPKAPAGSPSYDWSFDPAFDIFQADPDGTNLVRLTDAPGYDAEGTYSPSGKQIIFTSQRDGDLELYVMNADGSEERRLTNAKGYDGGAFFSPDEKQIVWRASRTDDYRALQVFLMNADGTGEIQLTNSGTTSFAPSWHPSGKFIIYSSNPESPRNFDLFVTDLKGEKVARITTNPSFDGFPLFSPDGKKLVYCANRDLKNPRATHVYVADWSPPAGW